MAVPTRDLILDAAAAVLRTRGLAHATTKEIARAAGYSEATLYKHFRDKIELMLAVLRERGPQLIPLLLTLPGRVGEGTVEGTLEDVATVAIRFYRDHFGMFASIFADPAILNAHREQLRAHNLGPHRANDALVDYLLAEQRLGRVAADADLPGIAGLLLGACFQRAFTGHFTDGAFADDAAAAAAFVRQLRV